jgi:hypothetical protein
MFTDVHEQETPRWHAIQLITMVPPDPRGAYLPVLDSAVEMPATARDNLGQTTVATSAHSMAPDSILVGVDGSEAAADAVRWAVGVLREGENLCLITVSTWSPAAAASKSDDKSVKCA